MAILNGKNGEVVAIALSFSGETTRQAHKMSERARSCDKHRRERRVNFFREKAADLVQLQCICRSGYVYGHQERRQQTGLTSGRLEKRWVETPGHREGVPKLRLL